MAWQAPRSKSTGRPQSNVSGPYAAASGVNFSAPLRVNSRPATIPIRSPQSMAARQCVDLRRHLHLGRLDHHEPDDQPSDGFASESQDHLERRRSRWREKYNARNRRDTLSNVAGPFTAPSGVNFSAPVGSLSGGSHNYRITATDTSGNLSSLSGSFTWGASSEYAAQSVSGSAASLSAVSNSAKVDWLYDLGGLLNSPLSSSDKNDTSANAVDAVFADS